MFADATMLFLIAIHECFIADYSLILIIGILVK